MDLIVTISAFLVMLAILVFVHELGHFVVARWMGIRVEEFGIGYPPRAVTLFERNGVKYTLNWLPLGGFVRFGGEDNSLYGTGSLAAAPPWRKIPVMVAGPLMNLVLAVVIFIALFAVMGIPTPTGRQQIGAVYEDTPASAAGFQIGDVLISLDNQIIDDTDDIGEIARNEEGNAILAVIEREGEEVRLTVTPGAWTGPQDEKIIGLGISYGDELQNVPVGPIRSMTAGVVYTGDILMRMLSGLANLIGGLVGMSDPPPGGVAGPIGIARATGEVIDMGGLAAFWRWMALLSLNLFVLNLLPIPALDGSHIVFSLIEWLRGGKKVPPEKEALVHAIGFATLMGLMVLISVSDILNALSGTSVLGGG